MSKVTPSSQFDQFSGKLSAFDRNVLRTRNGRIHSYVIHKPYKGPLAESRKSAINTFAQAVRQCKEEMMDEAKWLSGKNNICSTPKRLPRLRLVRTPRSIARFVALSLPRFQPVSALPNK